MKRMSRKPSIVGPSKMLKMRANEEKRKKERQNKIAATTEVLKQIALEQERCEKEKKANSLRKPPKPPIIAPTVKTVKPLPPQSNMTRPAVSFSTNAPIADVSGKVNTCVPRPKPPIPQKPIQSAKPIPPNIPPSVGSEILEDASAEALKIGGHVMITARAGTGKSFTMEIAACRQSGIRRADVVGSEQQEQIWKDILRYSKPERMAGMAFNTTIAGEMEESMPKTVDVRTIHSHSLIALRKEGYKARVTNGKVSFALCDHLGITINRLGPTYPGFKAKFEKLCEMLKANLMLEATEEQCRWCMGRYGIAFPKGRDEMAFELAPIIVKRTLEDTERVDFSDMIAMSVYHNIMPRKFDQIFVDEAQDMNPAQQAFCYKIGRRIVLVGDTRQAIYGFAGADVHGMDTFAKKLSNSGYGLTQRMLTYSRRCCKSVIRLAQTLVPDIEALPTAIEGAVHDRDHSDINYSHEVRLGDMVVCRTNAPLVSISLNLMMDGVPCWIEGKKFGDDLIATIDQTKASSIYTLKERLLEQCEQKLALLRDKWYVSDEAKTTIKDTYESLYKLADSCQTVDEVKQTITRLFLDVKRGEKRVQNAVRLSSIHKAKGLEAERVWFHKQNNCPHKKASTPEEMEQEWNLRYVAITRAKTELVMVTSNDSDKTESIFDEME